MLKKEKLLNFCVSVLLKLNMDEDKALKTSEILIEADMMGHYTHGTRLLPMYISDIEKGNMRVSGEVEIIKDTGPCVTCDGKLLPGIWLTHEAISLACDRWIPPLLNLVACPCGGVHALVSKDIML